MARMRLAVHFEGAICANPVLASKTPLPVPGALGHLIRCLPHYDVWIFSEGRVTWTWHMVDGWLLTEFDLYFDGAKVDNPRSHALPAMNHLRIVDGRPKRADHFVDGPDDWPSHVDTDALWQADAE